MAQVAIPATVTQVIRLASSLSPEIVNTVINKVVELATEVLKHAISFADILARAIISLARIAVDGITKLAETFAWAVVELVRSGERVILGLADMVARGLSFSPGQRHLHLQ